MIEVNGVKMSAASEQQFQSSLKIRPCSYNPSGQLMLAQEGNGELVIILPLNCKRLWFATYCEENHKAGRIEVTKSPLDVITEIPGEMIYGFVTSEAKVFINDTEISNGHAGLAVDMKDLRQISGCIQSVTGLAISKALSSGGFGVVDRFEIERQFPSPVTQEESAEVPFSMQENPAAAQTLPAAGSHAPCADASTSSVPDEMGCETASLFEQLGGTADPVTAAKSVKYPAPGRNNGKLLGTMSSRQLSYFITNFADRKEPEFVKAVEAAKLIYEDYQKKSGAAITSGK